jgi:hypothetical protein
VTKVVLQMGSFGEAVAFELAGSGWTAANADTRKLEQVINEANQVIFASWREYNDITAAIDRLCAAARVPWTSIIQGAPYIRVGPGILCGSTPCYGCFITRKKQHDRYRVLTNAIEDKYVKDGRAGIRGFLPHHAMLAAGLATAILDHVSHGRSRYSPIFLYHTLRHHISNTHVVGVHGCQRCGREPDARSMMFEFESFRKISSKK